LKRLSSRKTKEGTPAKAGIINISSRARNNPVPGLALYGATKAFVH